MVSPNRQSYIVASLRRKDIHPFPEKYGKYRNITPHHLSTSAPQANQHPEMDSALVRRLRKGAMILVSPPKGTSLRRPERQNVNQKSELWCQEANASDGRADTREKQRNLLRGFICTLGKRSVKCSPNADT